MKHWQDYFRSSYEMILAAEDKTKTFLNEELESYLVRLMTKWFDKVDIPPDTPVAILMLNAMQPGATQREQLTEVGEICLYYDSFKIKQHRWPTTKYYRDIGTTAYGMAYVYSNNELYEQMEQNFTMCSRILSNVRST